jgi:hypothetical protein
MGMLTCNFCGGSVSTCASCRGTCQAPVCTTCRDSDTSAVHITTVRITLSVAPPVVLV